MKMSYKGTLVNARFIKLLNTYVVEGLLIEDGENNLVEPPSKVRTPTVVTFSWATKILVTVDGAYRLDDVMSMVPVEVEIQ